MKKLNNKGFALVEVIIVAVFVTGISAFLFTNFLPLSAEYEKIADYDTVYLKYAAHQVKKMLLKEIMEDNDKAKLLEVGEEGYTLYKSTALCNQLNNASYCHKLFSPNYLNIKSVIITGYRLVDIQQNVKSIDDSHLRDYINYLPSYSKYEGNYLKYNRLIISFNDGTFANIEVEYVKE